MYGTKKTKRLQGVGRGAARRPPPIKTYSHRGKMSDRSALPALPLDTLNSSVQCCSNEAETLDSLASHRLLLGQQCTTQRERAERYLIGRNHQKAPGTSRRTRPASPA